MLLIAKLLNWTPITKSKKVQPDVWFKCPYKSNTFTDILILYTKIYKLIYIEKM